MDVDGRRSVGSRLDLLHPSDAASGSVVGHAARSASGEKAIGADVHVESVEGNGMKCPDCGSAIRFQRRDITCSQCSWQPPPAVLNTYRLAPLTNRRILLGTLSILITAGASLLFYNLVLPALILGLCGVALVPISFAVRSYAVKRMMADWGASEQAT